MPWLVLGPHVILATESSFREPHLTVLEMLRASRGEEGEPLPISPSSFERLMTLKGLSGQDDLMLWPSCSPPIYNFIQICPRIEALPSLSLASPSSLAAAVLHSVFAIQKPPEQNGCYPGERERPLPGWQMLFLHEHLFPFNCLATISRTDVHACLLPFQRVQGGTRG